MSNSGQPLPPYDAFDELAGLVAAQNSLDAVMSAIAKVGKRVLPGAAEVSVTLIRGDAAETVASTGTVPTVMDEAQYDQGAGPCLTAASRGQVVEVRDAVNAEQWPLFAARARDQGVGSSLSVPVKLAEPLRAALNLYGERPDAFAQQDLVLAGTLASYATVALTNFHLYESQRQVAVHLETALSSRGVIDQAKGILIALHGCSADEAFQILVVASQQSNRKLREVAEELVRTAASSAEASAHGPQKQN